MDKQAIVTLNRQLGGLKTKVTNITKYLDDFVQSSDKVVELELKLNYVNKTQKDSEELRLQYYKLPEETNIEDKEHDLDIIDDSLQKQEVRIRSILSSINKVVDISDKNAENSILNNENTKLKVKLPQINLPEFFGTYQEWGLFKSKFDSLITSNENLTNQQKLHYLQASLKGEAKQLQTPNDTFESLLGALQQRFENKRIIASSHINAILSLNKLNNESARDLRTLLDNIQKHIRSLELFDLKPDKLSQQMLVNIVLNKLDHETRRQYEMTLESTEFPDWEEFLSFLLKRCQILESLNASFHNQSKQKNFPLHSKPKAFLSKSQSNNCVLCKQPHSLFRCKHFNSMKVNERFDVVKSHNLCINCLSPFHKLSDCPSVRNCSCSKRHNSLLCRSLNKSVDNHKHSSLESTNNLTAEVINSKLSANSPPFAACASAYGDACQFGKQEEFIGSSFISRKKKQSVVLSTVIVYGENNVGNKFPIKAILDCGSMVNIITLDTALALGLKLRKINTLVSGIGGSSHKIKNEVSIAISNKEGQFRRVIDCLVVKSITDFTPMCKLDMKGIKIPDDINLSDKSFHLPSKIHMLLGNQLIFDLLKPEKLKLAGGNLILQNTVFGFTASGIMRHENASPDFHCGLISTFQELDKNIRKFWEVENLTDDDHPAVKSEEEQFCEEHFLNTFKRDESGRFTVQMPLAKDPSCLGDSKQTALNRLEALWKRLVRNPEMLTLYRNFIREYQTMGHMVEIVEEEEPAVTYYLPHHGVYRPTNSTTPLRVVFNASSVTSTGESLNSLQMNGGVIQEDLFSILLRFRIHKYALTADIKKMFRMIAIDESQRDLLRIVWKHNFEDPVKKYKLTTVTYGTTSAPYLATRSLKQLAIDDGKDYPLAAEVLLSDVYMDDILTGSDDLERGKKLQAQLVSLLQGACMQLHKWAASNPYLLPDEINEDKDLSFCNQNETKTLGLLWKPQTDFFSFKVSSKDEKENNCEFTKRAVLSTIAKLFDPLGLLGPIIARAKILMQTLWQLNLDWNDCLPPNLKSEWNSFITALSSINLLVIPRYCLQHHSIRTEFHGFADSSEKAFAAVIYIRCVDANGQIIVNLLCSKSKVAPLRTITIPRLELSGAVLLSKLVKRSLQSIKIQIDDIYLWSDSSIVLAWIKKPLSHLKPFVRNRVSIIQELTKIECWHHVSSKENPADILSRGLNADKIQECDLWWRGPQFLRQAELREFSNPASIEKNDLFLREIKEMPTSEICGLVETVKPLELINTCSSFTKLQRVLAWCRRFVNNARNPLHRETGCLKSYELSQSLGTIVRNIQGTNFAKEIECLSKGTPIPKSSKLLTLNPFLDSNGILRVGGRLKNSNLPISQRHPILLPSNHHFIYVVIKYFHTLYFHTGVEATLANIRLSFWIVGARNIVKRVLHSCITCKRVSARGSQQLMADLPAARVNAARIFSKVGIDFCGPFQLKPLQGRCKTVRKCFIAIFVCFSVKAIHFELVYSLSTEAFVAALKRFIARRGRPVEIYSDNGTNFVGAYNEYNKFLKTLFKSNEELENYLASEGIKWHFNPPSAPHFGGLWEAGVKSLKFHLRRVVGSLILSFEEFLTLVVQVEAVLNSRPLCPLSNDPNDLDALTPGHFLIGSSMLAMPDPDFSQVPRNRLSHWQLIEKLNQTFWKKWSSEYLNRLQQRPKWHKATANLKEGDLVLVKPLENSWTLRWHLARIIKIHPGKDGIVRVVTLRSKNGIFKRPVTKIANLPFIN